MSRLFGLPNLFYYLHPSPRVTPQRFWIFVMKYQDLTLRFFQLRCQAQDSLKPLLTAIYVNSYYYLMKGPLFQEFGWQVSYQFWHVISYGMLSLPCTTFQKHGILSQFKCTDLLFIYDNMLNDNPSLQLLHKTSLCEDFYFSLEERSFCIIIYMHYEVFELLVE